MADAQYQATTVYTTEDGLPVNDVVSFLQDSKGYLWIGTYGGGVSRFDGVQFKNYNSTDGLGGDVITDIYEDKKGGIWFVYESNVTRFYQNKFTVFYYEDIGESKDVVFHPKEVIKFFLKSNLQSFYFDYDKEKFIPEKPGIINPDSSLIIIPIDRFGNRSLYCRMNLKGEWTEFLIAENGKIASIANSSESLFKMPQIRRMDFSPNGFILLTTDKKYPRDKSDEAVFYIFNGQTWKPLFPQNAPDILMISHSATYTDEGHLLLNSKQGKEDYIIYEFNEDYSDFKKYVYSTPHVARRTYKDKAGTYWVASTNGLIRVYPSLLEFDRKTPNMVPLVETIAEDKFGKIWFGSYGQGLANYDGKKVNPGPSFFASIERVLPGSAIDAHGNMLFSIEAGYEYRGVLQYDGDKKWRSILSDLPGFFFLKTSSDSIVYGSSREGIFINDSRLECRQDTCWKVIGESKGLKLVNVITIAEDSLYDRIWMGRTSTGLAFYDEKRDTVFNFLMEDKINDYGVMSSAVDFKGNLWFGTDKGLCFLKNGPEIDEHFDPKKAFVPVGEEILGKGLIRSLKIYKDKTLIVGTAEGFGLLDLEAFYTKDGKENICFFDKKSGFDLGTSGQNSIFIDSKENIWIGAQDGAIQFTPSLYPRDEFIPEVRIDSLMANDKVVHPNGTVIRLKEDVNNIKIWYSLINVNPFLADNNIFHTSLTSLSDTISLEAKKDLSVEYLRLAPGDYTFNVFADKQGILSESTNIEFHITRYFYNTGWFWALLSGWVIFISFLGLKRKVKMDNEKDQLRIQAIVNQLNPHFINNILQWLQSRVFLKYEDEEMISVIDKLGKNIRMVFTNSRAKRPFHALEHEIDLVKNYLIMQKSRYGKRLQYQLPDPDMTKKWSKINVPLMVVQIHVENAIEHGIQNTENGGMVKIGITDAENYIFFTIEDDGIGREMAAKIGSKGTQQGTKMLRELITIYNKRNKYKLKQTYTDNLYTTEKGISYGTRVTIQIPKNYAYEFE